MATSTVPVFKNQLKTNLLARAGLSGVQVTHGPPLPLPETDFIWLGDVKGAQDWLAMLKTKQEHYDLTVWIRALRSTTPDDFKTAGDRVFALMAELENELRGDPTVTGTVLIAAVTGFTFREDAAAELNQANLEVFVNVMAQI